MRLAARLARVAGLVLPSDWVKIYESHNEYEWAVQKLLAIVDPWGDDRADFRAAVNTSMLVSSQAIEQSEEQTGELINALRKYLLMHNPKKFFEEDQATLDAISAAVARRVEEQQ